MTTSDKVQDYSLLSFFRYLIAKGIYGAGLTIVVTILCIAWLFSIPNTYKSEVLLSPTEQSRGNNLGASAGQLGGLASLAGISLGNESISNTTLAISVLESRNFAQRFIASQSMSVPLVAAESWDAVNEQLTIDNEIYDQKQQVWVRKVNPPRNAKPSDYELYEYYRDVLDIRELESGLISISFEHISPVLAAKWTEAIIVDINMFMRDREILKVRNNIQYLTEQAETTSNAEVKSSIYNLIQEQYKDLMLAEVNEDFVFNIVDPAVVPELKESPKRALIFVILLVLWLLMVFCVYLTIFLFQPSKI